MHMQHGAYLVSICTHICLQAQMRIHMRPKLRGPRCREGATTEGPGPHPPHHQRLGVFYLRVARTAGLLLARAQMARIAQ